MAWLGPSYWCFPQKQLHARVSEWTVVYLLPPQTPTSVHLVSVGLGACGRACTVTLPHRDPQSPPC